jgi:hypothetical protein
LIEHWVNWTRRLGQKARSEWKKQWKPHWSTKFKMQGSHEFAVRIPIISGFIVDRSYKYEHCPSAFSFEEILQRKWVDIPFKILFLVFYNYFSFLNISMLPTLFESCTEMWTYFRITDIFRNNFLFWKRWLIPKKVTYFGISPLFWSRPFISEQGVLFRNKKLFRNTSNI